MAVGNTLASDGVEEVVVLAHTCCAVLVDTGAVSLATTIEITTNCTSRGKEEAGIAVTSQWISGALGDSLIDR